MMQAPTISELIHHIKRCPVDFLEPPCRKGVGQVDTRALVNDVYRRLSRQPAATNRIVIGADQRSVAELSLMQICCWALSHPFFTELDSEWLPAFFVGSLREVAGLVKTEQWVNDEERAEELARLIMNACGRIPGGESKAEANDRYDSVNTVKRLKIIEETRAAMERAQEIRRKMAEAKAREAANVYSRE